MRGLIAALFESMKKAAPEVIGTTLTKERMETWTAETLK